MQSRDDMANATGSFTIPFLTVTTDEMTSVVYPTSGQVLMVRIDIREGEGDVLVNTNIFSGGMWQGSARDAVSVAQSVTGVDLSSKNVIFTVKSTNPEESEELMRRYGGSVDGPSAGGAMTVLLISELQGTSINNNTIMTGAINPDGTIGQVGGVIEKALAAGEHGARLMLVPAGQGYYPFVSCESEQVQRQPVAFSMCRLEERPLSEYTEALYGMRVVEVRTIGEALTHFQSNNQTIGRETVGGASS